MVTWMLICKGITPVCWSRTNRIFLTGSYATSFMFIFFKLKLVSLNYASTLKVFPFSSMEYILTPLSPRAAAKNVPSRGMAFWKFGIDSLLSIYTKFDPFKSNKVTWFFVTKSPCPIVSAVVALGSKTKFPKSILFSFVLNSVISVIFALFYDTSATLIIPSSRT